MKYVTPILIWLPRPACRIFAFILFTFSPFSFFLQLFYLCMWIIIELFSFQYFQRFHDVRFVTFDSCCCVQFQALLCVSSFFFCCIPMLLRMGSVRYVYVCLHITHNAKHQQTKQIQYFSMVLPQCDAVDDLYKYFRICVCVIIHSWWLSLIKHPNVWKELVCVWSGCSEIERGKSLKTNWTGA